MRTTADSPTIGLVLQRSHLVTGDEGHYSGVVSELEARGARVIPVFAGGLDFSLPVKKFFYDPLKPSKAHVDAVLSLTGFALVGGPARQDAPKVPDVVDLSCVCVFWWWVLNCYPGTITQSLVLLHLFDSVSPSSGPAQTVRDPTFQPRESDWPWDR